MDKQVCPVCHQEDTHLPNCPARPIGFDPDAPVKTPECYVCNYANGHHPACPLNEKDKT